MARPLQTSAAAELRVLRAYHEAGHAVAAVLRGVTPTHVSITRRGAYGGGCELRLREHFRRPARGEPPAVPDRVLRRLARAAAAIALGGSIAQDAVALAHGYVLLDPRTRRPFPLFAPGAEQDEHAALDAARFVHADERAAREFLRRMRSTTQRRLTSPGAWRAISEVAAALLRDGRLDGDRARALVDGALRRADMRCRGARVPGTREDRASRGRARGPR